MRVRYFLCLAPYRFRWQQRVAQKGMSVRDTERAVQLALKPPKEPVAKKPDRDVLRLQEELSDLLGAQVEIRTNSREKVPAKYRLLLAILTSWKVYYNACAKRIRRSSGSMIRYAN